LIETGRFFVVLVEEAVKPHRQEGEPCLARIGCALGLVWFISRTLEGALDSLLSKKIRISKLLQFHESFCTSLAP
jgi:hypothetical protein